MPVAAQATHRVHMEVMPLFAGYLPLPDVRLFKYLPHHSAHASQLDAGKAFTEGQMLPSLHKVGHVLITRPRWKVTTSQLIHCPDPLSI